MYENIAFGLRIAKVPAKEIDERVTEMLEIVSLKGFEMCIRDRNIPRWQ